MRYITDAGDYYLVRVPKLGGGFLKQRTFSKNKYGKSAPNKAKAYRDECLKAPDFWVTNRGPTNACGEELSKPHRKILKDIEKLNARTPLLTFSTVASLSILEHIGDEFSLSDLRDNLKSQSLRPLPLAALKTRKWIRPVGKVHTGGSGPPHTLYTITKSGHAMLAKHRAQLHTITEGKVPRATLRKTINAHKYIRENCSSSGLRLLTILAGTLYGLYGPCETSRFLGLSQPSAHNSYDTALELGFIERKAGSYKVTKEGRNFLKLLACL
ncbi:hypothetical protein QWI17_11855 [Gilvimarinus sp. SDUM040013]|uniref:Uncharacterized protein n=1 Tax=Gilvimarinus gilvus TaxID=3058038 RepID=A0ABU4RW50_9GAMM|nr:hypothetical protein [Gilvimarinus sp. SDUM040013]MDO3386530.1 hypothetical protein [Gilvimarinus sp. SDUM040013]MDX6849106.1 hypothetical protein [Gilvimarinus sp. SDUM040013]